MIQTSHISSWSFPPCLQSWSVREKLRLDLVCACRLQGTGSGVYSREMACSCASAWSHSALLWFSEKVVLRSSPRRIHTCCPYIGFESKISCTSVPKMLDVAEDVTFRWSFGARTELGVRQSDVSKICAASQRHHSCSSVWTGRLCSKCELWSTRRQTASPWRQSRGLNGDLGFHHTAESSGRRPTPGNPEEKMSRKTQRSSH